MSQRKRPRAHPQTCLSAESTGQYAEMISEIITGIISEIINGMIFLKISAVVAGPVESDQHSFAR